MQWEAYTHELSCNASKSMTHHKLKGLVISPCQIQHLCTWVQHRCLFIAVDDFAEMMQPFVLLLQLYLRECLLVVRVLL